MPCSFSPATSHSTNGRPATGANGLGRSLSTGWRRDPIPPASTSAVQSDGLVNCDSRQHLMLACRKVEALEKLIAFLARHFGPARLFLLVAGWILALGVWGMAARSWLPM